MTGAAQRRHQRTPRQRRLEFLNIAYAQHLSGRGAAITWLGHETGATWELS